MKMASQGPGSRSFQQGEQEYPSPSSSDESQFDIFQWYPRYQSCHRYFLDHAQHNPPVQALAAFVNITLPCHRHQNPVMASTPSPAHSTQGNPQSISLIPYIRRLVVTGFDTPATLHGTFGDDWQEGIGRLHEVERRNYLFASKSASWLEVKANYDMSPNETIPFMKPLQAATEKEILSAEAKWSDWLAMQDWMVGPRALDVSDTMESSPRVRSPAIKRES